MRAIKNMKISKKLILSFLIVVVLLIMVGTTGSLSLGMMSEEDTELYHENTLPMTYLAKLYDILAGERICANNMVIYFSEDHAFAAEERDSLREKEADFATYLALYKGTIPDDEEMAIYNRLVSQYEGDFGAAKTALYSAFESGDVSTMINSVSRMDSAGSGISDEVDNAFAYNIKLAENKVTANQSLYTSSLITIVVITFVAVFVAVALSLFISKIISNPVKRVLNVARQAGETGNLHFSEDIIKQVRDDGQYRDEIGQMIAAFAKMMDGMIVKADTLEVVAGGDLTPEVELASSEDTLGNAIADMVSNLNRMFSEINASSSQVNMGARQIANGAQMLAQGSTEQAASTQQLSSSISEVSDKTDHNAELAGRADTLSSSIRQNAEKGANQMAQMMSAVQDINEASQSISKVIKAIDDIAFQTNILALNAAVEAARAGQHGKGFAVVAEEVRSLAAKSADAAKDTNQLIENSISKAQLGSVIAEETSESLTGIVAGINESAAIIEEIARSSREQAVAIQQINTGIEQVAQVVQQNSATAEQSAAASEEMTGQADVLSGLVSRFRLKGERHDSAFALNAPADYSYSQRQDTQSIAGMGKY